MYRPLRSARLLPALIAIALVLTTTACAPEAATDAPNTAESADASSASNAPAWPESPDTPQIFFRSPADGATVAPTFDVVFGLRNYGVAPAGAPFPKTGHFHVLINVAPAAPGEIIPADSLHRHYGAGQIETQLSLAPGTYTLRLILADHEHRVIGPPLNSQPIRITVSDR